MAVVALKLFCVFVVFLLKLTTMQSDDRHPKVSQAVPAISLNHPPAETVEVVACSAGSGCRCRRRRGGSDAI